MVEILGDGKRRKAVVANLVTPRNLAAGIFRPAPG